MNEGELHLAKMRDQLLRKKTVELSGDELQLLRKLDNWHINHFRATLAYADVLDTWARQQLGDSRGSQDKP